MGTGIQRWIAGHADWLAARLVAVNHLKRETERQSDTWTDGAAGRLDAFGRLSNRRDADKTAAALRKGDI